MKSTGRGGRQHQGLRRWRARPLLAGLILALAAAAQPADLRAVEFWSYRRAVTISSSSPQTQASTQVLLLLTPANFDYAGARPDGADLRLSTDPDGAVFDLPFFIESWASGGTSRVWMKLPELPPDGLVTIYLYYGNPTARPASNFAATFPNHFISSGDMTLSGVYTYDWFELRAGDTLRVAEGQTLSITARNMVIAGQIDGVGSGYQPGATRPSVGGGPGGGGYPVPNDAGAGGGGHGNDGGTGGYDLGDSPGVGGGAYGSPTDQAILMGSAGGSTANKRGGAGGGALTLDAQELTVSGALLMRGEEGEQPAGSSGAGGGAGGGILLRGSRLTLTGAISVRGGAGSTGSSISNDGGGGGAGGRVKIFYKQTLANTATIDVGGGVGGLFGGDENGGASGQSGSNGSLHIAIAAYGDTNATVGARLTRTVSIYLPLVTN